MGFGGREGEEGMGGGGKTAGCKVQFREVEAEKGVGMAF